MAPFSFPFIGCISSSIVTSSLAAGCLVTVSAMSSSLSLATTIVRWVTMATLSSSRDSATTSSHNALSSSVTSFAAWLTTLWCASVSHERKTRGDVDVGDWAAGCCWWKTSL